MSLLYSKNMEEMFLMLKIVETIPKRFSVIKRALHIDGTQAIYFF